jgi:putative colanic acid biosysnthesis UDP-glucose lipid carrier transferase
MGLAVRVEPSSEFLGRARPFAMALSDPQLLLSGAAIERQRGGLGRTAKTWISHRRLYLPAKRFIDLAVAVPLLAMLLPLLLLLGVLIRLGSKGSALFRQDRLGKGGTVFTIYKLRSMTVQENGETVTQACRDDERVTGIGRFLRKSSLDELPQLINVIKGDMSLVGPRPHACAHDEYYAGLIEGYALRQLVKPGITGWAQVHGLRGETRDPAAMARRVEYDVWYACHAGFGLDMKILLRTPVAVIRARNAY